MSVTIYVRDYGLWSAANSDFFRYYVKRNKLGNKFDHMCLFSWQKINVVYLTKYSNKEIISQEILGRHIS